MTTALKSPKISPGQRRELEAHKQNLEELIRDAESAARKLESYQKKKKSLAEEAASLHRAAAQFDRDAEIKLAATLKQIERVHDAILDLESREETVANFRIVDQAQQLVTKLCQATFNELQEKILSALAPYYGPRLNDARYAARNAPAVNHLVTFLLSHRLMGAESSERIVEAAREVLHKIDALLKGAEIWRYDGGEAKAALEPNSVA